jgi:hypothetical protein
MPTANNEIDFAELYQCKRKAEVEIGCQQRWVQTPTALQNDGRAKLSTQLKGQ